MTKKKKKKPKVGAAYRMAHLQPPGSHLRTLPWYRQNVEGQRKFLAAQDAYQNTINRARMGTLVGNPYLR